MKTKVTNTGKEVHKLYTKAERYARNYLMQTKTSFSNFILAQQSMTGSSLLQKKETPEDLEEEAKV